MKDFKPQRNEAPVASPAAAAAIFSFVTGMMFMLVIDMFFTGMTP